MARDYNLTSTRVDKPAEHPAKAIMAKRWEERRAEARARRMAEKLDVGSSGLITLDALADAAAISSRPPLAAQRSAAPAGAWSTPVADSSTPSLASLAAELPAPADSSSPSLADLAAVTKAPAALELPAPADSSSPSLADLAAVTPAPAAISSSVSLAARATAAPAPVAAIGGSPPLGVQVTAAPAPAADSSTSAPAIATDAHSAVAPRWLRDSRKALLIVALISNGVLFALLYFGGFLG